MSKRSRVLSLVLLTFILGGVFSFPLEARRIKDIKYPAVSLAYSPRNEKINRTDSITASLYSYPIAATNHPLSTGLWIEKMVQEGSLNRGATLIYLSPYPCYTTGEIKKWQSSNWVRFVLEREYISGALIVFPPYMLEETLIKDRLLSALSTVEHDISLLDSLAQLPESSDLGEVIVVVDASYFSNQETPRYIPTDVDSVTGYPISLVFSTYNALSGLRSKGLDIRAVVYNTSPGFPRLGHAAIIQEWLLFYLEKVGL